MTITRISVAYQEAVLFFPPNNSPQWAMASSFTRFLDHTQRRTKSVGILWTSDQPVAETST